MISNLNDSCKNNEDVKDVKKKLKIIKEALIKEK